MTEATRAQTDSERAELERILRNLPSRLGSGIGSFVLWWAITALLLVFVWTFAEKVLGALVGWQGPSALPVLGVVVAGSALFALHVTRKVFRASRNWRALLREDIASAEVIEEDHRFVEARVFCEPEHGGLMYFLRNADDRVWCHFDDESQDLSIRGEPPGSSPFRPRAELKVVRAPRTRFVIATEFTGDELSVSAPDDLAADPSAWPDADEYCEIKWQDLDRVLGDGADAVDR